MQRLRLLFDAASVMPRDARSAWLAAECGSDEELRRDIESLLEAHESTASGALDRISEHMPQLVDLLAEPSPERIGPYEILSQAGRGGMGIVYRAHDPRLRRDIAVKCLPRALTAHERARERFIAEARSASALDHAGICTVHDVGDAGDGRLFIAMAWYGGGTLADRLRDGPLPVAEAVRIAASVADALDCAHRAGLVHRDIKPANIAFTGAGEVKVLDFGIAALESDVEQEASGTPRYMAPEQLHGRVVDRRADIWSLGVVFHEMLTGTPPFVGSDRSTVLAAISHSLHADHDLDALPQQFRSVVARALSRDPARRYTNAAEFAQALRNAGNTSGTHVHRRLAAGASAALVAVIILILLVRESGHERADGIDANVVVVLPFRVSGDTSLIWLREGMADLLSATLTGDGGMRAADPRTVYAAWPDSATDLSEDSARALAARIGAGNVLLGDIVAANDRLVVNTRLVDTRGQELARARTQGPVADVTRIVDALTAQLLSIRAGEAPQRIASLTSTSLPALRAYLEGQSLYRRGRHEDALTQYVRAMDFDSTFALAALAAELTSGWMSTDAELRARSRAIAWHNRERLGPADRAALAAVVGPNYPAVAGTRASIAAIDDGLRHTPDRVELWYMLGDAWLHHGRVLGAADWQQRAQAAFERALQRDSTFAPAIHHLALLHAHRRDIPQLDRAVDRLLRREPEGPTADFAHWLRAAARGQASGDIPPLDSLALEVLGWISIVALDDGVDVDFGEAAANERLERVATVNDRFFTYLALHAYALNRGHPAAALTWTARLREGQPDRDYYLRLRVLDALYADGDRTAAAEAAALLAAISSEELRSERDERRRMNRCVLAQWQILHEEPHVAPYTAARNDDDPIVLRICEAAAAALQETVAAGQAGAAVATLDSLIDAGPFDMPVGDFGIDYANIALARAYEAAGAPDRALDAIRRRIYFLGWQTGLATSLREEARLAIAAHDTAGALRAIDHYLALRSAPDSSLRAETEAMRRDRARLTARRSNE
ncbi:MAG: protein kinase domain-containing protein [Longimicrobiales bacterium]